MSNPTDSPVSAPRPTLKLKAGVQRAAPEIHKAPVPQPQSKTTGKPGAHWSDEYKARMQADMDALGFRR